ncbi:MAG: RluA family pseudouridine synthase [Clostridia bacterium]|nr:RluA family pseudouridine synthase [Clostridia bacterium]
MRFVIEKSGDGRLIRDHLRTLGVSGRLSARLKGMEDGILLNGSRVTVRAVLHAGDVLELAIEEREPPLHVLPRELPAEVLLEDEGFLAVNKPCNMPTHPSHGHFEDTLANALAFRYGSESAPFRPRFINRLDRNTTGVVLVARHALSAAVLSKSMAEGRIQKSYLALVKGRVDGPVRIESGIRRREESIIFREVCPVGEGDLAITEAEPLLTTDAASLLRLRPQTGRTHQLRVHLASVGHPLLGDELYGDGQGMARHALHAEALRFPHPTSGELLEVKAPLPADMVQALRLLGEEAMALVF